MSRSRALAPWLVFGPFVAVVLLVKLSTLTVPPYWDELGWLDGAHWLSEVNLLRVIPGLRAPYAFWGHPPGLHFTLAALAKIFGFSIALSHLIAAGFAALGIYFVYLLGKDFYDRAVGLLAAALLLVSPIYFAQAGMFLADLPVAALGAGSVYFALRRRLIAYLCCAIYMVFLKETGIAVIAAWLTYRVIIQPPKTKSDFVELSGYAIPLVMIGAFFVLQKITAGKFFFIYGPGLHFELLQLTSAVALARASEITWWIFIHQYRFLLTSAIALSLIIKRDFRSEFLLFLLICLFCGYSFSALYFLPRYILPVLPFFYLVSAWALLNVFRSLTGKLLAAVTSVAWMIFSLFTQPFTGNAEFSLRYLDAVRANQEMAEFIEVAFPRAQILTLWPHDMELNFPSMGYVRTKLNVPWIPADHGADRLERADLIYVTVAPASLAMKKLTNIALENRWTLVHTVLRGPVRNELYQRPQ